MQPLGFISYYGTKKTNNKWHKMIQQNIIQEEDYNTFVIKRYRNENKLTKFYLEFLLEKC